jgi:hypothetical protein
VARRPRTIARLVFPPSLASRLLAVGRWLAAGTLKATPSPCRDGVISTKQHMTFGEFYLHCAFTTRWHHDCCYCMHAALLLLLLRGTAAANDIYWPRSHPGPQPSARSSGPRAPHAIRHPYALRSRVFLGKSIGAQADEAGRTEGINSGEPPAAQPSISPTITAHTKTQSVRMRDRRYRNQRPVCASLHLRWPSHLRESCCEPLRHLRWLVAPRTLCTRHTQRVSGPTHRLTG